MASEYSTQDYIQHHLTNAKMCTVDGEIAFNKACSDAGFWVWNVDTLAWSIGLGLLFIWFFRSVAKKATSGVPTKTQAFVELIYDFVDSNVKNTYHGNSNLIAPLSLTIFVQWIKIPGSTEEKKQLGSNFLVSFFYFFPIMNTTIVNN